MGEIVLDRRKHNCKGPEGSMTHLGKIKKGCVARAQGEKGRKRGRGIRLTALSLPGGVNEPLTTTKAQACPIRTDTSHRLGQGPGAPPAALDAGFREGPGIPEGKRCWGQLKCSGYYSTNPKTYHFMIDRESCPAQIC